MMTAAAILDVAILTAIEGGRRRFMEIWPAVEVEARPLATERSPTDRVVDRRLQSLRKRGRIAYERGQWRLL